MASRPKGRREWWILWQQYIKALLLKGMTRGNGVKYCPKTRDVICGQPLYTLPNKEIGVSKVHHNSNHIFIEKKNIWNGQFSRWVNRIIPETKSLSMYQKCYYFCFIRWRYISFNNWQCCKRGKHYCANCPPLTL